MCTCQDCGKKYKIDLLISATLWEKIKPKDKAPGAGLLCGSCIMERLEIISDYGVWKLRKLKL